jgi:two-component system, sensor histidine kinase LadS
MRGFVTLCAVLVAALCQASAVLAGTVSLAPDSGRLQLGPHVQYLEDREGSLTIDQVQQPSAIWLDSEQEVLSFGYSPSAYWIRAAFTQVGDRTRPYILEVAYPVLDQLEVHVFEEMTEVAHFRMGDQWPYHQRPVANPNFLIPLVVQPGITTTFYLRILSTSAVQIPLTLHQDLSLVETAYHRGMMQALFYGAMLVMAIYNLLIFFSIRDINYLYYVLVVVSVSTLLGGIEGLTFKYLWPDSAWLNDSILIIALSGTVVFSALFFRRFLDIPSTRPLLGRVILMVAILPLFTMAGAFFLPYRPMILITIVLALGAIMVGFWAAIVRWHDGFEAAKYLNLAWSFVLASGVLFAFNKLGVLPRNGFTENVMQIGTGIQALLLSFALAYRMNYERDLRERAQQESVAAQRALLDQQIRAAEELDRLVHQRAAELKRANEQLKELGATDALTGVLNRRAFEERFEIEYGRACRDQSSLAILMIDLDHFKGVNDRYGHVFGDLCLVHAASTIRDNLRRPSDVIARYGGEEFIVMLPETDLQGAVVVAQGILDALSRRVVEDGNHRVALAASIGVAARMPGSGADRDALLKDADQNLYLAKQNGRNRVEWQPRKPVA